MATNVGEKVVTRPPVTFASNGAGKFSVMPKAIQPTTRMHVIRMGASQRLSSFHRPFFGSFSPRPCLGGEGAGVRGSGGPLVAGTRVSLIGVPFLYEGCRPSGQ